MVTPNIVDADPGAWENQCFPLEHKRRGPQLVA
jgi:hypothetical protein